MTPDNRIAKIDRLNRADGRTVVPSKPAADDPDWPIARDCLHVPGPTPNKAFDFDEEPGTTTSSFHPHESRDNGLNVSSHPVTTDWLLQHRAKFFLDPPHGPPDISTRKHASFRPQAALEASRSLVGWWKDFTGDEPERSECPQWKRRQCGILETQAERT